MPIIGRRIGLLLSKGSQSSDTSTGMSRQLLLRAVISDSSPARIGDYGSTRPELHACLPLSQRNTWSLKTTQPCLGGPVATTSLGTCFHGRKVRKPQKN
jgi:hypothetical protein